MNEKFYKKYQPNRGIRPGTDFLNISLRMEYG